MWVYGVYLRCLKIIYLHEYQESIEGSVEPALYYIARNGKMLATMCSVDRQGTDLFVAGTVQGFKREMVSCESFEQISPILDLTREIVQLSGYNGIACMNFKFVANTMSKKQLAVYLDAIKEIDHSDPKAVMTNFSRLKSFKKVLGYDAVPKIFEINARSGEPLFTSNIPELVSMLKVFLAQVAADSD